MWRSSSSAPNSAIVRHALSRAKRAAAQVADRGRELRERQRRAVELVDRQPRSRHALHVFGPADRVAHAAHRALLFALRGDVLAIARLVGLVPIGPRRGAARASRRSSRPGTARPPTRSETSSRACGPDPATRLAEASEPRFSGGRIRRARRCHGEGEVERRTLAQPSLRPRPGRRGASRSGRRWPVRSRCRCALPACAAAGTAGTGDGPATDRSRGRCPRPRRRARRPARSAARGSLPRAAAR